MLNELYANKQYSIKREDYEALYEAYITLKDEYEKLSNRSKTITKLSDKQLASVLNKNDIHTRDARRFNIILKHSDKQGTKTFIQKKALEEELELELLLEQKLLVEIENTQKEIVCTLGTIGESRSKETGNHVRRVAEYSKLLALHYGLGEDEAENLRLASPMHDIGKVTTPDHILNKPGALTQSEFEIMKEHAGNGYDILKYSSRPLLQAAAIVAREHHEKYDGTGYPLALKGEMIHIFGRITAVADVFDALGSNRVYKKAWNDEKIFEYFHNQKGKHFDPQLIDIFFTNIEEFLAIRDRFED